MFQNIHSSCFFLIHVCLIPDEWQNILITQTQALIGPDPWLSQRETRHGLSLDAFTCLWKLLFPEQVTHVNVQHRKFMFSLSALLFHLQKHRCPSGQSRQYLSQLWIALTKVFVMVIQGLQEHVGNTSAKEEELVAQWLCPTGVVMCTILLHCWAPQATWSCQGELATANPDYVFSNFDLTTLIRLETQTWYSTSNSFKLKDSLSIWNLLPPPPLCNISWPSKTYYLSLEHHIVLDLSRERNTELSILHLVPRRGLFLKTHGSLVAKSFETQGAQHQKRCYLAGYVLQSHLHQTGTCKRKW